MKLTISRSFSAKIQLRQFEPIDSFCAAQAEYEVPPEDPVQGIGTYDKELSAMLDNFCRAEVQKTLASEIAKHNLPEQGKGKAERKEDSKNSAELDAGLNDLGI